MRDDDFGIREDGEEFIQILEMMRSLAQPPPRTLPEQ
jgi:hypothetical protein